MEKRFILAMLAMVFAGSLWGTSYTFVKIGLMTIPLKPLGVLSLRFFLALVFLLPLFLSQAFKKSMVPLLRNPLVFLLGTVNGISYSLQFIGQEGTTAGLAALMVNMFLISTPIISIFVFRDFPSKKLILSLILGTLGVIIVSGSIIITDISEGEYLRFIMSTLLVLISGLVWGGYGVVSRAIYSEDLNPESELHNAPAVFFVSNFYSALVIIISSVLLNQLPKLNIPLESWIVLCYLAIFCTIIPFTLYIYSSRILIPSILNIVTLINVVVGIIMANIILGEELTTYGILGSMLILISIYLAGWSSTKNLDESETKINEVP